jgi:hypothetical protein
VVERSKVRKKAGPKEKGRGHKLEAPQIRCVAGLLPCLFCTSPCWSLPFCHFAFFNKSGPTTTKVRQIFEKRNSKSIKSSQLACTLAYSSHPTPSESHTGLQHSGLNAKGISMKRTHRSAAEDTLQMWTSRHGVLIFCKGSRQAPCSQQWRRKKKNGGREGRKGEDSSLVANNSKLVWFHEPSWRVVTLQRVKILP